jgi:transcription antitermination factor NusG
MPLLPLEAFVYPEDLFAASESGVPGDCRWWVLHTRPRAEKALSRRLLALGQRFFLPLFKKQWRNSKRSFCAYHPLFAGYLFLFGDSQDRLHALETNLVARMLAVEDQVQMQRDLARVHQLMLAGAPLWPESQLQPGTWVRIISGPLMGMAGKIITRHNKMRFFVEVRFLQQGVSLDIESWMIERLTGTMPTAASA